MYEMTEEYYAKYVTANWYDSRLKKTIEVYAITYEMSQKPDRENILTTELLKDYSGSRELYFDDKLRIEAKKDLPIYPVIEIGTVSRRDMSDRS